MALLQDLLRHIKKQHETLKDYIPLSDEQQRKLDRKFRLEFNYNSNHLEGNTLTYGETELLLLFDQTTGNHELREYEEMKAHDVALKMVEEEAADLERPLTEQFIRSLNKHLLVRDFWKEAVTQDGQPTQKKIIPGEYKKTPNSVRLQNGEIFDYVSPDKVGAEMSELVSWFNAHMEIEDPVILASLLHYRFVRIHPFDDGNGRVARLLMNYVLLRRGYPVVVIKTEEKKDYLAALNRADAGDLEAFSAHIADQVIWSFDIWLKAAKGESIEEEDDLDKELALLKKDLDQRPDSFDKRKSTEEVQHIVKISIIKLIESLDVKLGELRDYFVSIDVSTFLIAHNLGGDRAHKKKYTIGVLKTDFDQVIIRYPVITSLNIGINCLALKKIEEKVDIVLVIDVKFDDFHYILTNNVTNDMILKKPYGQELYNSDVKLVENYCLKFIIHSIRTLTGL